MKSIPHSQQHECALLSCMLQQPDIEGVAVVDEFGNDNPFYIPHNKEIYNIFLAIDAHKITIPIIIDYVANKNVNLDIMSVRNVINAVPSVAQFDLHLSWVKKLHVQRKLIWSMDGALLALSKNDAKVDEIVDGVNHAVKNAIVNEKQSMLSAAEMLDKTESAVASGEVGYNTYIHKIDEVISPIPPGTFMVIGGRMGMGKTTLYNSMQLYMGAQGQASALFSMEMPVEQITKRMVAALARKNSKPKEILQAWNDSDVVDAKRQFAAMPIYCKDTPGMTEVQLAREIKAMHAATGCKWFAVDHIGLVQCSKRCGSREESTTVVSNKLKEVAMEIKGVIVGLSQLNRGAESEKPGLDNISRSDAIAQDADVVLMVHGKRDQDDDEQLMKVLRGEPILMDIIIAKSRHTNPGRKMIPFYKHCSLFANDVETNEEIGSWN